MRWLVFLHRYVGIAIGALMLIWCLSGAVMMYVRYPELSAMQRQRHLPPIDWRGCCTVGRDALPDDARVGGFQVEMLRGRPVLRMAMAGRIRLVDLTDGHAIAALSAHDAGSVAAAWAASAADAGRPRLLGLIERDQWTVSGEFNAERPLFRFVLADAAGTQLYVSAVTGRVVQATTARERFWNWLGAVPHWLYFAQLRRHAAVWTQIVIWLSLTGSFLTLIGIYIGVQRFLRRPPGRWSPYRGLYLWHHAAGLLAGLLLLTWVVSGLISMNPWGFLDSEDFGARLLLRGEPPSGAQVKAALRALPAAGTRVSAALQVPSAVDAQAQTALQVPAAVDAQAATGAQADIVSVEAAPLLGRLYLALTTRAGTRLRLDESGAPARIDERTWRQIEGVLGGDAAAPQLITADAYYFSRPGDEAPPVYRIVADDGERTRYYLDPLTAAPVARFDSGARGYRWLFQGLHTLDFSAGLRERPRWDVLMLVLLAGAAVASATGTYVGWRRLLKRRPAVRARPGS